jgi:hypothetical protein
MQVVQIWCEAQALYRPLDIRFYMRARIIHCAFVVEAPHAAFGCNWLVSVDVRWLGRGRYVYVRKILSRTLCLRMKLPSRDSLTPAEYSTAVSQNVQPRSIARRRRGSAAVGEREVPMPWERPIAPKPGMGMEREEKGRWVGILEFFQLWNEEWG